MMKVIWTFIGIAVVLVGWGMTWANQNARICENQGRIEPPRGDRGVTRC
ncbi:MAG: hypothetical protein J7K65_07680 [Planctomycetes bacterium]|nr:hypothetical protein [Planctomycetota bacterium]